MKRLRSMLGTAALVIVSVVIGLSLLIVLDKVLSKRTAGYVDLWQDKPTMSTFDWYPYSGHHIQAHFHQVGPDLWNEQDFDVQSGDHGFFVDFPLDSPPAKAENEFRLIVTGGSAAQGFGGRTNEDMFYRRLEKQVNAKLAGLQRTERVRIINLAMGGAISYQNFLALNLWGHTLAPDAILSMSGFNELSMYEQLGSNLFMFGVLYGGYSLTQRHWESQWWQKFLAGFYPSLFRTSVFAQSLRLLSLPQRAGQFLRDYQSRFPREKPEAGAAHFQAHALSSMLRDFPAVRLLFVTQPFPGASASYDSMQAQVVEALMRDPEAYRVRYLNAHDYWKAHNFFPGSLVDGIHLSNEGHSLITDFLTEPVVELVTTGTHR